MFKISRRIEDIKRHVAQPAQITYLSDESYFVRGEDGEFLPAGVNYIIQLAEQGDAEAQYRLGVYFCIGIGVKKDQSRALEEFKKSADQGNEEAKMLIGSVLPNLLRMQMLVKPNSTPTEKEILEILTEFVEKATLTGLNSVLGFPTTHEDRNNPKKPGRVRNDE